MCVGVCLCAFALCSFACFGRFLWLRVLSVCLTCVVVLCAPACVCVVVRVCVSLVDAMCVVNRVLGCLIVCAFVRLLRDCWFIYCDCVLVCVALCCYAFVCFVLI